MNSERILSSSNSFNLLKSLILVVDDDRAVRMQLRHWLEAEGYRVVEAADGAACLSAYEQQHPDLVLLDIILPDQDGLECCKQIQRMSGGSYTPILMMTSCEDEASINRAFAWGAIDYIVKPIAWSILRHRLKRLLQDSRRNRNLETENQQLMRLATLDSLTQIPNRRRFDEHLDAMWRQMVREGGLISMVIGDVDFFKAYNDTYGHPTGDQCLQTIAKALSQCCHRPLDLVSRYGGEEFGIRPLASILLPSSQPFSHQGRRANSGSPRPFWERGWGRGSYSCRRSIILPQTDLKGALNLTASMKVAIEALQLPHRESLVDNFVTMSFGAAAVRPSVNMWSGLLLEATDEALYKAKAAGRKQAYGVEV